MSCRSKFGRHPGRLTLLFALLSALVCTCGSVNRPPLGGGYSGFQGGRGGGRLGGQPDSHIGSSHIPALGNVPGDIGTNKRCQVITIPMCLGIGYNYTSMPNQYSHETQEEAGLSVHQFWPLVEIGCSQDLRFFLCSMYAPICIHNYDKHLPVCRSVCQRAQSGCAPLMRQYGFSWPEHMDCSRLPVFGDPDILCMDVNSTQSKTPEPLASDPTLPPADPAPPAGADGVECDCKCRQPLLTLTEADQGHYNRVHTGGVLNCALPCDGAFFADRAQLATVWTGIWSILCAISSTLTVLTFLLDTRRFSYPERPIVMMSACYMMVSAGYILRLAVGREAIACDGRLLRYGSTGPWLCTVVFLLTYLFGMASCVWWVALCVAWFLAAGLKWGSEAIAKYSEVFHCVAWFLPIAKFILALTFSLVDGDPVSGICSIGNTSLTALQLFVLAPMVTYLLLGSAFLLTGFVALFRIRSVIKQQACAKTYKLEKLMIRIGIFSILYTLPACVVIACHFYEAQLRDAWLRGKSCRCLGRNALPPPEPEFGVFMLRQFMQLAVGITSGVWVWSGKTLLTWRAFFCRLFCCERRAPHSADPRPHYKFSPAPGHPPLPPPPLPPLPMPPSHMSQV